jgi:hypothetical protein
VKACTGCGTTIAPIRADGECFRCHVRGIGFTYTGGGHYGRANWNQTRHEWLDQHIGDPRRDDIERAS